MVARRWGTWSVGIPNKAGPSRSANRRVIVRPWLVRGFTVCLAPPHGRPSRPTTNPHNHPRPYRITNLHFDYKKHESRGTLSSNTNNHNHGAGTPKYTTARHTPST